MTKSKKIILWTVGVVVGLLVVGTVLGAVFSKPSTYHKAPVTPKPTPTVMVPPAAPHAQPKRVAPHTPTPTPTPTPAPSTAPAVPKPEVVTPPPVPPTHSAPSTPPPPPAPPVSSGDELSPSGKHYRNGEFCAKADNGNTTHDDHGDLLTCEYKAGQEQPHWVS